MNTPAQEHVCYDLLSGFERGIREHPQKEADTSNQKNLEINLADKIEALLEDYPACDALIRFSSYLDAEVERYRNINNESRKEIVENVVKALHRQIKGDNSLVAAMLAARYHDKKCRELARKDWLNHVDFMALIGILDGVKSLELDEAKIEDKQYLVESFKERLPSEKLILLNESPAFPCTPMELADWFEQIKLPLNKIIPSFVDELAAIEATKAMASPETKQNTGWAEAESKPKTYAKKEALINLLTSKGVDKEKLESLLSNANKYDWLAECKSPDGTRWNLSYLIYNLAHNTNLLPPEMASKFVDKALDEALGGNCT